MAKDISFLEDVTLSKMDCAKSQNWPLLQKDPIKAGIIICLVVLISVSTAATFIGAVIAAFANIKLATLLLALYGASIRMVYKIILKLIT